MILIFYSILLIISIGLSALINRQININIMINKVKELSRQTTESVNSNINTVIDSVNNSSKMLISNRYIQSTLTNATTNINYNNQKILNNYLSEFTNFRNAISSIYIFDNYGNKYFVDNESGKAITLNRIKNMYWYDEIITKKGGYILKLNGDGLYKSNNGNYISLIRIINNIDNQKPIGVLIINIHETQISDIFKKVHTKEYDYFILKDEKNQDIVSTDTISYPDIDIYKKNSSKGLFDFRVEKSNNQMLVISKLINEDYRWTLMNINSFDKVIEQYKFHSNVNLIIILINGAFIFLGSLLISKLITKPIKNLILSMDCVKKGDFKPVIIETGNNEIGEFKEVYNIMIMQIQTLINKIIADEKINREAELKILQAQIKPHFLYNTFDAISSLSLSGRNRDVYTLIKALGSFYRTSLNNGEYTIYIEEEIKTVKSYMMIQNIRYNNMFTVNYYIDSRLNRYKIIKLILQPLVENAIYHGIKPTGKPGIINIRLTLENHIIKLIVEDNGIGMSKEQISKVMNKQNNGIGISATIERLEIFYGRKDIFRLDSVEGVGTKVTIVIPEKEEFYEHKQDTKSNDC